MGYVPLRPPGAVRLPPRSPASRERAGANCASCGAPVHSSEHRCAWCLTPNPGWRWIDDAEQIEVTTLGDAQRVFVSASPLSQAAVDELRQQWFEQRSRPGVIVPLQPNEEPPPSDFWVPVAIWLCLALGALFIIL